MRPGTLFALVVGGALVAGIVGPLGDLLRKLVLPQFLAFSPGGQPPRAFPCVRPLVTLSR